MPYVATRLGAPRRHAAIVAKILDAVEFHTCVSRAAHPPVETSQRLIFAFVSCSGPVLDLWVVPSSLLRLWFRGVPVVIALVAVVIGAGAGMLGADWRLSESG